MSLIVEDGTGLANAESLVLVAEADTYHNGRGNSAWALLSVTRKEQLLRQASDFLYQRYRGRWNGWRSTTTQALDWPRLGVILDDVAAYPSAGRLDSFAYMVPSNNIPAEVKMAQCELALIAIDGPLTPRSLTQSKHMVKAGPVVVEFDTRSPQAPRYPAIAALLAPYLKGTGTQVRIDR
jgi:hypothetical protein